MMKALDLLPDGTFAVRDGARAWVTRRPTIGEWRGLVEAVQAVDERASAIERIDDAAERIAERSRFLYGETLEDGTIVAPAYSAVMARILTELGPAPVDANELPVWCTGGEPIKRILPHWREVPLDLSAGSTTNHSIPAETAPAGSS